MVVMGCRREGKQALSRNVGMMSKEQEESLEDRIA
jgi:hypothetical protein